MGDGSNADDGDSPRGVWLTVVLWVLIIAPVALFLLALASALAGERPAPVKGIAIWGGLAAAILGVIAGLVRITWTKGLPMGQRDPLLDHSSPYLRRGGWMALLLGAGVTVFALGGTAWTVYWYPASDPRGHPFDQSPEAYVLPPLFLCLPILATGTYLLTIQLYSMRVVRKA